MSCQGCRSQQNRRAPPELHLPTARLPERGLRDSEDLEPQCLSRVCVAGSGRPPIKGSPRKTVLGSAPFTPLLSSDSGEGEVAEGGLLAWRTEMPRNRERVCLQDGLKLNLCQLIRQGLVQRGRYSAPVGVRWTHSYWGEVASGTISADLTGHQGWLQICIGNLNQRIRLACEPRHFGGVQWYFVCPARNRLASVLWKPSGATKFCSRQTWQRQVAYQSQFSDATGRAHLGQARIKARLIRDLDPDDWDLPPKPKWMRWRTYDRYTERHDHYAAILDYGCAALVAKWMNR